MVNMMKLMKQAQAMQSNMQKLQSDLAERTYEFSAGGGVVKAVAKGDMTVVSLNVDPKAVDPQDVEMLQDLVISAVNGALKLARDSASEEMGKITGGLNIPGM